MAIVTNASVEAFELPGLVHWTVAGRSQGLSTLEVWIQTLAPGAKAPLQRHARELAIVVLRGSGLLRIEGKEERFGSDSTLIVPRDSVHRIENTSDEPMLLVSALGASRAAEDAGGDVPGALPLPWDESAA